MPCTRSIVASASALIAVLFVPAHAAAQWIELLEGTDEYVQGDGLSESDERSFEWGDLNQDGRLDLVVVRKQPFSTTGRRINILYMNEDGVLVDRTGKYAIDADDGGQGFLDITNDRDVIMADVNGDGWLDVITAVTLGDGLPKTISHPRIYINKGASRGQWLGLRYEQSRIPQFDIAPRFHAVAAGDVTGNGMPDLYFGYNRLGFAPQPPFDLHDRLLINSGAAVFVDESEARMTFEMRQSYACLAVDIMDMNLDGANDVIKCTQVTHPMHVAIIHNDPSDQGNFETMQIVYSQAQTSMSIGDLNNSGALDLVITDDGIDRYLLNQSAGPGGQPQFANHLLPEQSPNFGGDSVIADLDDDGWRDILIADVNFDIPGCDRLAGIYRNNADGPAVTFADESSIIPDAMRQGVFDAAVLDIDGDGSLDIVLGRCQGLEAWVQKPGSEPDLNSDGSVNVQDLLMLLAAWGECPLTGSCQADLDASGGVDVQDMLILLANWG